jgi:hypothetical protein
MLSHEVRESLASLRQLRDQIRGAALRMLEAGGGALYSIDIVAIAALNRALSVSAGFESLLTARNFVSAAALLRMQLDTALRFSAFWRVTNPDEAARRIVRGVAVRDLRDRHGQRLTDRRLVELFEAEKDWVPEVYEKTSGFVHLSVAHVAHAMSAEPGEHGEMPFQIAESDDSLSDQTYHEAIAAFLAATDLFLELIENWAASKAARAGLTAGMETVGIVGDPAAVVPRIAT